MGVTMNVPAQELTHESVREQSVREHYELELGQNLV